VDLWCPCENKNQSTATSNRLVDLPLCSHVGGFLYAAHWQREKGASRIPRAREVSWAAAHQVFLLFFFFLFSATFLKDF
jgi:hypothetical protein